MAADGSGGGGGGGEGGSGFDEAPAAITEVEINGTKFAPLADGIYDAIIMGTGLTECIVSGLLSVKGMKVLHVDRNGYYGGDSASLNLTNLYQKFVDDSKEPEDKWLAPLGQNRDYNVDLTPKFLMAHGKLVKILIHSKVTRYLDFKVIDGSFVYKRDGGVQKVPATEMEAINTSLMGFFQKRKFRNFVIFVYKYNPEDRSTHEGLDLKKMTTRQLYAHFDLDQNTQDVAGHAMALHVDESYLDKPALATVLAIQLYGQSIEKYGVSPYLYPVYGLGGLPESFSRLCAINRGTFMLNRPVDEILFDGAGKAVGIRCGAEAARAPIIVGHPSYFPPSKIRQTGKVVRSVCILDHPVSAVNNLPSAQIIIPQNQVGRRNDIYVSIVSHAHCVAAKGKYIAIASTTVETERPVTELDPAVALLRPILQRFDSVVDTFEPVTDGREDRCFIAKSLDATSHFETVGDDVLDLYRRITGEELDMTIAPDMEAADG